MQTKRLGNTGLHVSEICLGTMTFGIQADEPTAFQIMDIADQAVNQLAAFFESRHKNLTHVALAWVLAQPTITSAILGASKPAQLTDSLQGVSLALDEEEMQACNEVWYKLPREQDPTIARR